MAKSSAERQALWRDRVALKERFFGDLDSERRQRIRAAFPGDGRPEVSALLEYFARYPRCHCPPRAVNLKNGVWCVYMTRHDTYEAAAAKLALSEVTSLPVIIDDPLMLSSEIVEQVKAEVAELRRLNMWDK
jgi:hypothetical protein